MSGTDNNMGLFSTTAQTYRRVVFEDDVPRPRFHADLVLDQAVVLEAKHAVTRLEYLNGVGKNVQHALDVLQLGFVDRSWGGIRRSSQQMRRDMSLNA